MSIQKTYLKSKPICKVTFQLTKEEAMDAKTVALVGDFNNWKEKATPMRKLKSGIFKVTIDLENNNEYQFRYLIDGEKWQNDGAADKYVETIYQDALNSVVVVD